MPHRSPKSPPLDHPDTPMSAHAFRDWRKRLHLKQKEAADLLGLKKRMIQYYETGKRGGKDVSIPKSIRLACYALEAGVVDYDGTHISGSPALESAHPGESGAVSTSGLPSGGLTRMPVRDAGILMGQRADDSSSSVSAESDKLG